MDQQVSPAVVVIVLILIVAILVGLYFLVVERKPGPAEDEPGMNGAPIEDVQEPPEAMDDGDQAVDNGETMDEGENAETTEDSDEPQEGETEDAADDDDPESSSGAGETPDEQ